MLPVFLLAKAREGAMLPLNPFQILATGAFGETGIEAVEGLAVKFNIARRIGALLLAPLDASNLGNLRTGRTPAETLAECKALLATWQMEKLRPTDRPADIPLDTTPTTKKTTRLNMNTHAQTVFEAVRKEADRAKDEWIALRQSICDAATQTHNDIQKPKLEMINRNFEEAVRQLHHALSNPTLVLAVAGSTSSGKSSFLNFLLREELLPTDPHRITAGYTHICRANHFACSIRQGENYQQKLENPTVPLIYRTLEALFLRYHEEAENLQASDAGKLPAPPEVTIEMPFLDFHTKDWLDLPDFLNVKLLDLPGREAIEDLKNQNVIDGGLRNALGIITYHASQAVKGADEELLKEVADQVHAMGSSPARLLFVLNRVDELRKSWDKNRLEDYVAEKTAKIKQVLKQRLPGNHAQIDKLIVVPFSSEVALLGSLLRKASGEQRAVIGRRANLYGHLFPKELEDDLPRNPEKWNEAQCQKVAKVLWEQSGAENVLRHLRQHIATHLPEIVIPPVLDQYWRNQSQEAQVWAITVTQAVLDSSTGDYEKKTQELLDKESRVGQILDDHRAKLERFSREITEQLASRSPNDPNRLVREIYGITLQDDANQIGGIADWIERFHAIKSKISDSLLASFSGSQENLAELRALGRECGADIRQLIDTIDYLRNHFGLSGENAIRGCKFEEPVSSNGKSERIQSLLRELDYLASGMANLTNCMTQYTLTREQNSIKDAIGFFMEWVINRINQDAREITGDFVVSYPSAGEVTKPSNFQLNLELDSETEINREIRPYVKRIPPRTVWEHIYVIFGGKIIEKGEHTYEVFPFPGVQKLIDETWGHQIDDFLKASAERFHEYLQNELGTRLDLVKQKMHSDFEQYRKVVETNREQCKETFEAIQGRWLPIRERVDDWEKLSGLVGFGFTDETSLCGEWKNDRGEKLILKEDCSWLWETAAGARSGTFELEAPLLWLTEPAANNARHLWGGRCGVYLMPAFEIDNRFTRSKSNDENI
jgi:predicted GTPase